MSYYYGWKPYVSVAKRRTQALREMKRLRKKGIDIQPVEVEGRTIARSFWGKGWCEHLESFGDYSNRLPRGRTYVRNGSICHLAIQESKVKAIVSDSELYEVEVEITLTYGEAPFGADSDRVRETLVMKQQGNRWLISEPPWPWDDFMCERGSQ